MKTKPAFNPEKRKATLEARSQEFSAQAITVDANWRIIRADPKNWEVQFKGDFHGYFGNLPSALCALPAKMLSAEARGDVKELVATHKSIVERIEKTIQKL